MVKSLLDLCTSVCIRNVGEIYDVGDLPYRILKPILLKVNNPEQLHELERLSPQIQGEDAECWERLINDHFPSQVKKHHLKPSNPLQWSKVYRRYKLLEAEEKEAAIAKLSKGFNNITKEKQAKAVKAVTFDKKVHGRIPIQRKSGPVFGRPAASTGGLTWGGGSRTKTSSAQGILQKARREAAEIARRKQLSTPTGQLLVRKGQITQAPLGMVEEHRIKSLPSIAMRRSQIQAPMQRNSERWERQQREREARLLKAKSGPITPGTTIVSDDDLAQDDTDEDSDWGQEDGLLSIEDLESLGEKKSAASHPSKPAQTTSTAKPGSTLSGLAQMKMGHAWKDRPTRIERVVETAKASSSSSSTSKPAKATSPPSQISKTAEQIATPAPTAYDYKPRPKLPLGLKRKAPSVFMPPKQKARRMS